VRWDCLLCWYLNTAVSPQLLPVSLATGIFLYRYWLQPAFINRNAVVRFVHFHMKSTDISELKQEFLSPLCEREKVLSIHISVIQHHAGMPQS